MRTRRYSGSNSVPITSVNSSEREKFAIELATALNESFGEEGQPYYSDAHNSRFIAFGIEIFYPDGSLKSRHELGASDAIFRAEGIEKGTEEKALQKAIDTLMQKYQSRCAECKNAAKVIESYNAENKQ